MSLLVFTKTFWLYSKKIILRIIFLLFIQEAAEVQSGVLIFCDDPSVEKAVHSAVDKFNERLSTGHKLALFQILKASKVQ